jgi:hypothetical protein
MRSGAQGRESTTGRSLGSHPRGLVVCADSAASQPQRIPGFGFGFTPLPPTWVDPGTPPPPRAPCVEVAAEVAAGLLLDRPGAVPLLLRAVAEGRASRGVAAALAARAAEPRRAAEAMTADLQEAVEMVGAVAEPGGRD